MGEIDFSPLKDTLNNMAIQLAILMIMCAAAYTIPNIILRLIKIPGKIANFLSGFIFLIVMYYLFMNNFIPGIQGTQ
jgi:hypothetical protein